MKIFERKDKNEKRRLALEKQSSRRVRGLGCNDSNSVSIKTIAISRRLLAVFIAIVITISGLVVGFNFFTKAEEYSYEDAPIEMQVMVDGTLIHISDDETSAPFTVQFPSALIENGDIAKGISFEKLNNENEVVVNSIRDKIDARLNPGSDNKHFSFSSAILCGENLSARIITNVKYDNEGNIVYLEEYNDLLSENNWHVLNKTDKIFLDFETEPVQEITEATLEGSVLDGINEAVEVPDSGVLENTNGVLPTVIKGLFKSPKAKTATHLEPVDFMVMYNSVPQDSITISVPAGKIEESMTSESVIGQEDEKLYSQAEWMRAVLWKYDSVNDSYLQYEISNIGKYDDTVYYSFKGNNEDTGIALGPNDKIYLIYSLEFNVSYEFTPVEGGSSSGNITEATYGNSLPVSVSSNDLYTLTSLSYNVKTPNGESYIYSNPIAINNGIIPSSDVKGDIVVFASFTRDSSYWINGDNVDHGHICGQESLNYSASDNGAISQYGPIDTSDTMRGMQHGVTVSAGGTAYLVMYGQKNSNKNSETFFLNAIWLKNGDSIEEIKVPTTYSASGSMADKKKETNLSAVGTKATVELISTDAKDSDLYTSSARNASRYKYLITIEGVKSNIEIETYFRPYYETKMYLKGMRGIANTATAHPTDVYWHWIAPTRAGDGNNMYYFFDENGTNKTIQHSYKSLDMDLLDEEVQSFQSDLLMLAHQLKAYTHNYLVYEHKQSQDFHIHSVYMAKVKPGYNSNSIAFSDLLANYDPSIGASYLDEGIPFVITTNEYASTSNPETNEALFRNLISDRRDTYTSRALGVTSTIGPAYYCYWDTSIPYSSMTNSTVDPRRGECNIYTKESEEDTFNANRNAISQYIPFLTGAKSQHYYNGIALPELNYYNNSMEVNATSYKYLIEYDLQGASINLNNENYIDGSTKYYDAIAQKDAIGEISATRFVEKHRHTIEKATDPSSNARSNEFDNVEDKKIVLPKGYPSKAKDDEYMYSFAGWELVKYDETSDRYIRADSTGRIYKPGEVISLDAYDSSRGYYYIGSYQASGTGNDNGTYAQKCQYDVISGEADKGMAWGDYTSPDENALTFTFVPVWDKTPIGGYLSYNVLAYKDTPNGALTDATGTPISVLKNGKPYYLYYKNTDNKAAPESEIISLNQHYPTDGVRYTLNSDLTDEKIDSLVTEEYQSSHAGTVIDDTIIYYYDVSEFEITITEKTQPAEGSPDYTSKEKEFEIILTLTKNDGSNAEPGSYGDVIFSSSDGKTEALISLASGDSAVVRIPYGYKLAIDETDASRSSQVGIYTDSYLDSGTAYQEAYPLTEVTNDKTIIVINSLEAPDIASGIMDSANPIIWVLIGMLSFIVIGTGFFLWKKKDEFVEQ